MLDLVVGELFGNLNYYENTGTATAPTYTARTGTSNPWDGIDCGDLLPPRHLRILTATAIMDLVVGEEDGVLNYYENTGTASDSDLRRAHRHRQPVGTSIDVGF